MGIFRQRPPAFGDNNPNDAAPGRHSTYGDAFVQSVGGGSLWALADEGSYYVATNATLATGVAGHAAPVVADTSTKPYLFFYNGGSKVVFPDFAQFEVTAAGTAGTLHYAVVYIDASGSSDYTSGGSAITPVATYTHTGAASGITMYAGAVVIAMTSAVKVGQQIVREVIPVVQDTVTVVFGSPSGGARSALTTAGTATNHSVIYFPPVAVSPGGNFNFSFIRPSQSGASSYQFQFGYFER